MTHANWYVAAYIAAASGSTGPAGSATDEKPPGVEVSLRTTVSQPSYPPVTSASAIAAGAHKPTMREVVVTVAIKFLFNFCIVVPNYDPLSIFIAEF